MTWGNTCDTTCDAQIQQCCPNASFLCFCLFMKQIKGKRFPRFDRIGVNIARTSGQIVKRLSRRICPLPCPTEQLRCAFFRQRHSRTRLLGTRQYQSQAAETIERQIRTAATLSESCLDTAKPPNVKPLSPDAVITVGPDRHPHRQSSEGWRSRNSLRYTEQPAIRTRGRRPEADMLPHFFPL